MRLKKSISQMNLVKQNRLLNNCKLYRKEECAGLNGLCDDYEFAPTIPKEEVDNWPTEMGPYVTGYGRRRR